MVLEHGEKGNFLNLFRIADKDPHLLSDDIIKRILRNVDANIASQMLAYRIL